MIILDEVHNIAVCIGKSENMRVTAGEMFAAAKAYVYADDSDGAQQLIATGFEPNQNGLWRAVTADPSYPEKLGKSFSTGERLLQIGKAPVPAAKDADLRAQQAEYRKEDVREPISGRCETLQNDYDPIGDVPSTDVAEPQVDPVEAIKIKVQALSTDDTKRFADWFAGHLKLLGFTPKATQKPKPVEPAPRNPRVDRAVELFFAAPQQAWIHQRINDGEPGELKGSGPHVDWVRAFYGTASDEERQAIKAAIQIEENRRKKE